MRFGSHVGRKIRPTSDVDQMFGHPFVDSCRANFSTALACRSAAIPLCVDSKCSAQSSRSVAAPSQDCRLSSLCPNARSCPFRPFLCPVLSRSSRCADPAHKVLWTFANIQAPATSARAPASAASAPTAPVSSASGELNQPYLPADPADIPGALTCAASASVRSPRLWASSSTTKKCLDEVS